MDLKLSNHGKLEEVNEEEVPLPLSREKEKRIGTEPSKASMIMKSINILLSSIRKKALSIRPSSSKA